MLFTRQSPPPFYQPQLSAAERERLDRLFVGSQATSHYLKAFARFDRQQRMGAGWNWAAFMMTLLWMLYRKRYLDALVYAVAGWSFVQLVLTLTLVLLENTLISWLAAGWHWPLRLSVAGGIYLLFCILTACWADAYYYRVARREISETIEDRLSQAEQARWLKQEGGVSLVGGGLAALLLLFVLGLAHQVYLPMYASYQTRNHLDNVLDMMDQAVGRLEPIYQATGQCPVGQPMTTSNQASQLARLEVQRQTAGSPPGSPCQVVATIHGLKWPASSVNGQHLVRYRPDQVRAPANWSCYSSMNGRDVPLVCRDRR